jgi:hypothetical protein
MDQRGVATVPIIDSPDVKTLRDAMEQFRQLTEQSPANVRLRDL